MAETVTWRGSSAVFSGEVLRINICDLLSLSQEQLKKLREEGNKALEMIGDESTTVELQWWPPRT